MALSILRLPDLSPKSAAAEAGGALEKAFKGKVEGAAQTCPKQRIFFRSVVLETLEGFHKNTGRTIMCALIYSSEKQTRIAGPFRQVDREILNARNYNYLITCMEYFFNEVSDVKILGL